MSDVAEVTPTLNRTSALVALDVLKPVLLTPSLERQEWLERAVEGLRARFAAAGYDIPRKIRTSIGWPKRAASCGAVGECWSIEASSDGHHEVFVSPELMDGAEIVGVLTHELVHATVGNKAGHGKPFSPHSPDNA